LEYRALHPGDKGYFICLPSTYNGTIDETYWRFQLRQIGIPEKAHDAILRTTVTATIQAFAFMMDVRRQAYQQLHQEGEP